MSYIHTSLSIKDRAKCDKGTKIGVVGGTPNRKKSTGRGDAAHTFLMGGHNWGGGKMYAGREGGHSTNIVEGGNNWVGDTAQHSSMKLSVAIIPLCGSILQAQIFHISA